MFDWMSNGVEVSLDGDAPVHATAVPAVNPSPATPDQDQKTPSFLPNQEMSSRAGEKPPFVEMTLEPDPEPGVKLAVHGKSALLAQPFHLPPDPYELLEISGEKKKVAAVVPVTLAIVGKNRPIPLRFDWAIPVYSETMLKSGESVLAWFAVDALAGTPVVLPRGDYVAYLLMEGHVFGPVPFHAP